MNSLKWNIVLLVCVLVLKNNIASAGKNLRIIGGTKAKIEDHPWMVSFLNASEYHMCGGSLINDDTVVSAAHCFVDDHIKYAVVGVSDLRHEKTLLSFKEPKLHEKYDRLRINFDNDIAIIKLKKKVVFSPKIQPIRLPKHDLHVPNETPVITAGWGRTDPMIPIGSDDLLEVKINIVDWQTCKKRLSHISKVTERMICAGNLNGGQDSCQGDSGGPLELNGTLIGVVSWGNICGTPGYAGVYTKVSDFVTWINKKIEV
ncbi:trypsin 5G1-like [Diabrotica undecimpunctata]|uniref:trypsin 5G1-like n=1 Tax=Diabrotica undecimpunctata TaxID=50387 RepID=UPI003B63F57A